MRRRVMVVVGVVALLASVPGVARASDDPDYEKQFGPQQLHAPEAWAVSTGKGVTIAIVDTGVSLQHADLRDKLVHGYDFADDDDQPDDEVGHGTHVAGIAAAATDNGVGIAGVAPDAKIMPIRVPLSGSAGSANDVDVVLAIEKAIRFATDNGAKVINLSLGEGIFIGPEGRIRVESACADAFGSGALCVVAAGNDGKGKSSGYRSDFQGVLVAANDKQGNVATFSQKADTQWGVTAPGVSVYSTWLDNGYMFEQGTSMAAPHVSGVAALLFAQGLSNQQVVDKLLATATPMNDGGGTTGAGLVNAAAAVGAPYAEAEPATAQPTTATTAAPVRQGGGATVTTVPFAGPTTTATLLEGTVEESSDFTGGDDGDFASAAGADAAPVPISTSDGFTASFLVVIAVFVGGLGVLGFAARRIVLRRGIGQIREV
jgi:thermitase